jgi:Na+-transporting NADH:ubiquinone oxidoreductase subunit C
MTGQLDPENFDIKKIWRTPDYSEPVPSGQYTATMKRVPTHMIVYFVKEGEQIEKVIFPVYGNGLWSTMYGFIALDKDLKTIKGLTFYEHGETPGLGGEIENPNWKASWKEKIVFNHTGELQLKVLKGRAGPGSTTEIDGLSGATLTTVGVDDMIVFWFGPRPKTTSQGKGYYRPFLDKLKKQLGGQP